MDNVRDSEDVLTELEAQEEAPEGAEVGKLMDRVRMSSKEAVSMIPQRSLRGLCAVACVDED